RTRVDASFEIIRGELVEKRSKVHDSFDGRSRIQSGILRKIEIKGWILIATQIEADKKGSARKLAGISDVNTKVVFDVWLRKCLVGGSTIRANIDSDGSN